MHLVERWLRGTRERRDALEVRFVKRVLDSEHNGERSSGAGLV